MTTINNDAQVILLLTSPLVKTNKDNHQPITRWIGIDLLPGCIPET